VKLKSLPFFVFFIYSCGNVDKTNIEKPISIDTINKDTTVLSKECIQRDTITPLGTRIHYTYTKGKFQISWGDNSYKTFYDSLFPCFCDTFCGLWDLVPKFKFETKNNLVLVNTLETSSGCNSSPLDFSAFILPKNKKDSVFEKELFIDCEGDYLIYGDWDNVTIHILNLETKNNQNIILTPNPDLSRSPTMSIKETKIKNNVFHIKYETLDKNENIKVVEKIIRLEI
jgi:hypothetical protein